jgi:hypothetical protein
MNNPVEREKVLRKCFHYTNLQPLEGKENIMKGAKLKINAKNY